MKKEEDSEQEKKEKLFQFFDKIIDSAETSKQWAYIKMYTFFIEVMVYKLISVRFRDLILIHKFILLTKFSSITMNISRILELWRVFIVFSSSATFGRSKRPRIYCM